MADDCLYGGWGGNIVRDESGSADFFNSVGVYVEVVCLLALSSLFVLLFDFIYANNSGLFSRLVQNCYFDLLLILSLDNSVGLLIVLSLLFLHRHYFFNVLLDLLQNCKLWALNAGHVFLDLCILSANVYNYLWSWLWIDDAGNYHYVKIFDCHFFGFLIVDHFDVLSLFFECVNCFDFVDNSAACRGRLNMHFLYVAVVCFYTDPLVAIFEYWAELRASWNDLLDVIGSSDYSIFASCLLDVVRPNGLIYCRWTHNRCWVGRAVVDDNYLLLFVFRLY